MLKIVVDDEAYLEEMSENITEYHQSEPCANCEAVKDAVKRNDEVQFAYLTNYPGKEVLEQMNCCKRCMWYYIDEIEFV